MINHVFVVVVVFLFFLGGGGFLFFSLNQYRSLLLILCSGEMVMLLCGAISMNNYPLPNHPLRVELKPMRKMDSLLAT